LPSFNLAVKRMMFPAMLMLLDSDE